MTLIHLCKRPAFVLFVVACTAILKGVSCQGPFTTVELDCRPQSPSGGARIMNGINATKGEFPFMVSLQEPHNDDEESYFQHFCAGTFISSRMILTAAHCIWNKRYAINHRDVTGDRKTGTVDEKIRAAGNPYCRHQEGAGLLKIGTFHIHPDYTGFAEDGADIALLQLTEEYNGTNIFADVFSPASFDSSTNLTILGWGFVNAAEADDPSVFTSTVRPLQKGFVTMKDQCSFENTFCASGVSQDGQTIDTCRGDSGGPVLLMDGDKFMQVGITSYGEGGDCVGSTIGVYTRISYYTDWIDFILSGEGVVNPQATTASQDSTPTADISTEGGCVSYSTLGPNQLSTDEGSNLLSPGGGIVTKLTQAKECAAACEVTNAKCGSVCCDSFAFNSGRQECWLKQGSSRDTREDSGGFQTYWRENDGTSTGEFQVCEQDWKAEGYVHAYMTKGPRQLSQNEGISLALSNGARSTKVSSVDGCAVKCEAVSECDSFSYNPSSRDCYVKKGQTLITQENGSGWQSYWQMPESAGQTECAKSDQYCIYCGGSINQCRSY